jgi:hypothetical protein
MSWSKRTNHNNMHGATVKKKCNTYIAPTINIRKYSNFYGVMVSAANVTVHFNVSKFLAAFHVYISTHTKELGYSKSVTYESGLLLLNQ